MPIETEITVSPQAFASAVAWAAKWVPAKPNVPVWGGLSLTISDNSLTIGAYNESASVRAVVECAPYSAGSAVVSGRLLASLAATLTGRTPVTLASTEDGTAVTMRQGRWVVSLPAMAEDDYPTLPGELPTIGTVAGAVFARGVARAGIATPDDADKAGALLMAMHLEFDSDGIIEIMASDRYRVGRVAVPWEPAGGTAIATPLGSRMLEAAAAFDGPDDVRIGTDGRGLSLSSPTRSLTMATIDTQGEWPAELFRKAYDDPRPLTAVIEPAALIVPLKRASIVRGKAGGVSVRLTENTLAMVAGATLDGLKQESDDEVEVDYSGPETLVGFNPDYLADALASAPGAKVTLHFGTERKHVILTSDDDPSWRHVLMPVVLVR